MLMRPGHSSPTTWRRSVVVTSISLLALAGCSDPSDEGLSALTDETAVTLSSVPLCDPNVRPGQPGPSVSDEVIVWIGEAIDALEQRYQSSSTFALVGWQTVADGPQIVVVFTDQDPDRDADIETLIAETVGAELASSISVRFTQALFSAAQIQAAEDLLFDRFETHPEMPLTGASKPQVMPDGSVRDLYRIELWDLTDADTFAERYDLPPPYDIYCIDLEEQGPDYSLG